MKKSFQLESGVSIIGRDLCCSILVTEKSLSRKHAAVELDENGICKLTDLGSVNGTWRNELLLKPHVCYELRTGDRIKLGNVTGIFLHSTKCVGGETASQSTQLFNEQSRHPVIENNTFKVFESDNQALDLSPSYPSVQESDMSSDISSHLLSCVVIDRNEVADDLIPNASQFVSRSPSPVIGSTNHPSIRNGFDKHSPLVDTFICETQPEITHDETELRTTSTTMVPIHTNLSVVVPCCRHSFTVTSQRTSLTESTAATSTPSHTTNHMNFPLACDSEPRGTSNDQICDKRLHTLDHSGGKLSITSPVCATELIEESEVFANESDILNHSNALNAGPEEQSRSACHEVMKTVSRTHSLSSSAPSTRLTTDQCQSFRDIDTVHDLNLSDSTQPMMLRVSVVELDATQPQFSDLSRPTSFNAVPLDELPTPYNLSNVTSGATFADYPIQSISCIPNVMTVHSPLIEDNSTELTQPMIVRKSLRSSRRTTSMVDLDKSESPKENTNLLSARQLASPVDSLSPPIDEIFSKSIPSPIITPVNSTKVTEACTRRLQTATRLNRTRLLRTPRSEQRVSAMFMSNMIGVVQFRSRRRHRRSLGDLHLNTSQNSLPDSEQIIPLTGDTLGLVRRASQCLTTHMRDETVEKMLSRPKRLLASKSKPSTSTKCRVLHIPSPVRLLDSVISDDPSQLEDSLTTKVITKVPNTTAPSDCASDIAQTPLVLLPVSSHLLDAHSVGKGATKSASRLAGFDDSSQDSLMAHDIARLSVQKSPLFPIVQLSSCDSSLNASQAINTNVQSSTTHKVNKKTPFPQTRNSSRTYAKRMRHRSSSSPIVPIVTERLKQPKRSVAVERMSPPPLRRSRRLTTNLKRDSSTSMSIDAKAVHARTRLPSDPRSVQPHQPTRQILHSSGLEVTSSTNESSDKDTVDRNTACSFTLLFSGVEADRFNSVLSMLGASETDNVLHASHLITESFKRTLKMLYARARGIPIVSVNWLIACKRFRKPPLPSVDDFLLTPPINLSHFPRRSSRVLSPPRREQDFFMSGWSLRCTPAVLPPPDDLARLHEIAGGRWMSDRQLDDSITTRPIHTVIITTPDEVSLVQSCRRSRKSKASVCRELSPSLSAALLSLPCVSVEWFLQTIMQRASSKWPVPDEFILK